MLRDPQGGDPKPKANFKKFAPVLTKKVRRFHHEIVFPSLHRLIAVDIERDFAIVIGKHDFRVSGWPIGHESAPPFV
jgi:hypothetical protein